MLELTEECIRLANRYLELGVIPPRKTEDALHAAIATCNEMDALISWNLKHLSNFNRMERINGVNQIEGYNKHLVLITPAEVSEHEDR